MGPAGVLHDGRHVGKVQVDNDILAEAHQLGDGGHRLLQNVVGDAEGVGKGDLLVGDVFQPVVGNDDQGVYLSAEVGNALLCLAHPVGTLKLEGLGDDAHGEDTCLVGQVRHNGCCAGTGAAAHTGGDEHHVGPFQGFGDCRTALLGRLPADFRLGACAHASRQLLADLELILADRLVEVLLIGIDHHKIHAADAGVDHAVDNIISGAADADDFDFNDTILD